LYVRVSCGNSLVPQGSGSLQRVSRTGGSGNFAFHCESLGGPSYTPRGGAYGKFPAWATLRRSRRCAVLGGVEQIDDAKYRETRKKGTSMKPPNESTTDSAAGDDARGRVSQAHDGSGLSRRRFLQAVGLGATAASIPEEGLLGKTVAPVRTGEDSWGPNAVPVTLNVNGESLSLKVEPRVTLLDALRNHMQLDTQEAVDLTGPKRVCDRSSCGACTVMIDGKTVYACSVLAVEAQGSEITTIEGFGDVSSLHPVQDEFVQCDGSQCGFCTPGFVVSSIALLRDNPSPSGEEIDHALAGNICRCGTQVRVKEAVQKAAHRLREGR